MYSPSPGARNVQILPAIDRVGHHKYDGDRNRGRSASPQAFRHNSRGKKLEKQSSIGSLSKSSSQSNLYGNNIENTFPDWLIDRKDFVVSEILSYADLERCGACVMDNYIYMHLH